MRVRNGWFSRSKRSRWVVGAVAASVALLLVFASGSSITEEPSEITGAARGAGSNTAVTPPPAIPDGARFGVSSQETAPAETGVHEAPGEALWQNGELLPPLPRDPALRRAAIDQARATAAPAGGRTPDVTYLAVVEPPVEPEASLDLTASAGAYQPSEEDLRNINLRIPDDFEIPPDVLRTLSESATMDEATEAAMESQLAQALIQDFHGIDQTTLTPPDCDLAVSPDYIVLVVNAAYAVYDKCGTQIVQANLSTLTSLTDAFLFDPKVVFDEWDSRWILSFAAKKAATNEAWICLVVSQTSLPMGVGSRWTYNYPWSGSGTYWGDYPDLGVDPDCVYITTNDFNWSSPPVFQTARICVLDKAQIYVGGGSTRHDFTGMTNPGDATLAFAIRAAEMYSFGSTYFLVNSKQGGGSILTHWEITGAPAAPVLNGYNIAVGAYDDPPPLLQSNGVYVDCGDARLLTAKYYFGQLWCAHAQRINWGEPTDRSGIEVYIVNTGTRALRDESGGWGASGAYYAYPAVDFDDEYRGIVCFSRGGPTEFIGTRYVDYVEATGFSGSSLLVAGQANYAGGGSGTIGDPHRWGDYFGCDVDLLGDGKTLWFYGQFASSSPNPSWDTWVGAASFETAGVLDVAPATAFKSTGLQGGPFTPPGVTYTLSNTGGTGLAWTLTGLASWNTASATKGFIDPGNSTNVTVNINSSANIFGPGTYTDIYTFSNCYTGAIYGRSTQLTVGIDGACAGSVTDLLPPDVLPYGSSGGDNEERGMFVTALKDFDVCAIGIEIDLDLPQLLTARIYAASGTARGALLATSTLTAVQPGKVMHYIPISYTLQSCQEYDIAVEFGISNTYSYWDDRPIKPFDRGGVLRIRDGELDGVADNFALLHFSLLGSAAGCPMAADLDPKQGTSPNSSTNDNQERGVYIKAEETVALCALEWKADLVAPQTITARVYQAVGTTRGALLAEGTLDVASSGMMFHNVPVGCVLEEGKDYDLAVTFGLANSWPWWSEGLLTEPYAVGAIRVVNGEMAGDAVNTALPHFRVGYTLGAAGAPFDLAKGNDVYPPPLSTGFDDAQYGMYVKSLIGQELYSIGWRADVPGGSTIAARIYGATGTTRGALLSEGWIASSGAGMKWHDIPLSASLAANSDYDLAVAFTTTTEWCYWDDRSGLPYEPYGVIRVVDGERDGSAANYALMEMRMNGCNVTATGIGDPVQPPKFALMRPYPNPVSGTAVIPFSLEETGPVTLTVYDVLGRRVTTLLDRSTRPAGPGEIRWNAGGIAAGVYFVKLEANQKSVSRKIAIVR